MDSEGLCALCGSKIFVMLGRKKAIPSSAVQTGIKGRKEWKGVGNQLGKKHLNFKQALRLLCLRRTRGKRDTITLLPLRGGGIHCAFKLAKYRAKAMFFPSMMKVTSWFIGCFTYK